MTSGCYSCDCEAERDDLPLRESIAQDAHWRLAHAFGTALPGWLVLVPRRHVTSIAELTDDEATTLGVWQVRASRALHQATNCLKTYVIQFAEAEGFAHVHFHIVPRAGDLAPELRGRGVFELMSADHSRPVEVDSVSAELARLLAR